MRHLLFIVLLFFLNIHSLSAQYRLSGRITNKEKKVIIGAKVILTTEDELIGMTLTDLNGWYRIENLSNGEYLLRVEYTGYTPISEKVFLHNDMKLDYVMLQEMVGGLDEVVVTAERQNVIKATTQGNVFYLSTRAQKTRDVYSALQEIPRLQIDELNRSISTVNGGKVLMLVNGVPRGNALESIDPKDILSVEVMETPSARYLSEGFTNVVNIKTRKNPEKYSLFNFTTQNHIGLHYGTGSGAFEIGDSKASFYVNVNGFYFNNNHANDYREQRTSQLYKQSANRHESDYFSYNATLGGDWVVNAKNYFSYNVSLRSIPTNARKEGKGILIQEADTIDYISVNKSKTLSLVNVYNIYHHLMFEENSSLENQMNFTYNKNEDRDHTSETGNNHFYDKATLYKMDYYKGYVQNIYEKKGESFELSLGNRLSYEKTSLRLPLSVELPFRHNRWKEYMYASFSQSAKWGAYSASVGMDMIFNQIGYEKNDYYRLKYSVSGMLHPLSWLTLKAWVRGYTEEPGVAYLNPYNTSTDSLSIVCGNPQLKPSYRNDLGYSMSFNIGNFYISPELGYTHHSDIVSSVGYTNDHGIYTSTYENKGSQKYLYVFGIVRYNIKRIGNISFSGTYHRNAFYNGKRDWFSKVFRWNLAYKTFSFNGHVDFMGMTYTPTIKEKSSIESLLTIGWNINSSWKLIASMRYFLGGKIVESWIDQEDYYRYTYRSFDERKNMLLIGFRYNWTSGRHKARKNSKLKVDNNRVELLSE